MRRFGESDKITEAKEVLTLIRGELASSQSIGSSGSGIPQAQYVTLATDSVLTNERVLTAGDGIDLTDGGAGTTVTLAVDVTDILGAGLTETSNNLVLGTPTTLTNVTTNSVAGTTHAHALDLSGFDLGDLAAGVFANPTASVGLAAVNGAATTAMRSDAAPALDQGIVPTWTGAHTWDDGTGDSPALNLVGGSNNDTATIWLADDAVAGNSDLVIRLPAADNDSLFIIQNSTPAGVAFIGGGGQVGFTPGPVLIGTSDSVQGQIQLYGEGAASDTGGIVYFHLAADHDTTFATWNIDVNQDDLRIYSSDAASIHYFRAGGNVELAADLSLATGQGIIHADGVAAGQVLRADGTRYIPDTLDIADITDLAYGTPALTFSTANAAGAASTIMRTDATLAIFDATVPTTIEPDDAAAAGSAGVAARRDHAHAIVAAAPAANSVNVAASAEGVGTSFSRADHTHNLDESIVPTWTGIHTHQANVILDDGTGDSPAINFVGGSNDDTATLFLDDDAVAGNSDLVIRLPAADNDSLLLIQSSTPATMAYIGGGGQVGFGVGPVLVGTSDITRGQIQLYSEGTASSLGGILIFHVAADYDTTFATWNIDANEDDLRIYSSDAASIHYFRAGGNVEIAGDFNLATGKGVIHADGVTSGYILQADGTRYVPADPAGVLPVAPSARGHILRAEVGPVWASYAASTAGAVLIGDGTDVISDTTPTLVGDLTMDDGTGNSPAVNFVGGTNNDTAKVYLADNATVTDSDLIIQLCDTAGDSVLGIHDSTPAAVLEIDSNGNVELQNDGTWIGRGAASARIEFNAAGNAVKLYSGADLELYSDAGSTKVGTWDGATGDILLDDGSGDSPAVQFIGGTNNDTIKIFLDDWAVAGGSDLNVQLADAAGESNFEIWDSTPAAVLKINSDGDLEMISGNLYVNDTTDATVTRGVVINQGAADDTIISLKSSDVAHGITDYAETDSFSYFEKREDLEGGLLIAGLAEGDEAFLVQAMATTDNTTKSLSGRAAAQIWGNKKSGTGLAAMGANANLFAVANGGNTLAIIDAEGELHLDLTVSENAWDDYDDLALLDGLRASLVSPETALRQRFGQWMEMARPILESTGVITYNDDGHHFVAVKQMQMLIIDALRQSWHEQRDKIACLEKRVNSLENLT